MVEYDRGRDDPITETDYRAIKCPDQDGHAQICTELKQQVLTMMDQPDRFGLPASAPSEICEGLCSYPAQQVFDTLQLDHLRIVEAGMMNFAHIWLEYEGRHYDPERPQGVYDYRNLPVFDRQRGTPGTLTILQEK